MTTLGVGLTIPFWFCSSILAGRLSSRFGKFWRGFLVPCLPLLTFIWMACTPLTTPEGWSGGIVVDDNLYIGTLDGEVWALDASTGEMLCHFELTGEAKQLRAVYGTPVIAQDRLFIGGYDGFLYVLPLDCMGSWESDEEVQVGEGGPIVASPIVIDNTVAVASSDGNLYAFEIEENESRMALRQKWARPFPTGNKIWSTPAVSEGIIFFGSLDHSLYAVSLDDGSLVWNAPFRAKGGIAASPTVADGRLYFGAFDNVFYAIDASNGEIVWTFEGSKRWFWGRALVDSGRVYAPSLDGNLYALNQDSGAVEWKLETEGSIIGTPVIVADRIAVVSDLGGVYLAKLSDGSVDSQCKVGKKIRTRASLALHDRTLYFLANDHAIRSLELDQFNEFWRLTEGWEHFTNREDGPDRWEKRCS